MKTGKMKKILSLTITVVMIITTASSTYSSQDEGINEVALSQEEDVSFELPGIQDIQTATPNNIEDEIYIDSIDIDSDSAAISDSSIMDDPEGMDGAASQINEEEDSDLYSEFQMENDLLEELIIEEENEENLLAAAATFAYSWKGPDVNPEFLNKVLGICNDIGANPDDLMAVMAFESGLNHTTVNSKSGATGLIQFMPATATGLGTTTTALKNMTALQQLDYVKKYFTQNYYANHISNLGDLYMAVLWPAGMGKADSYVLFSQGSAAYRDNSYLDGNRDGAVTKLEAYQPVINNMPEFIDGDPIPIPSGSVSFDTMGTSSVSASNAVISTWVRNSGTITEMGFYLGSSSDYQNKIVTKTVSVGWTDFHLSYNLNDYFGALSPGMKYYYVFYVVSDGREYKSSVQTFTTGGSAVIHYGKPNDCSSISDNNAHIGAWFWNDAGKNISSLGVYHGTSMNALTRYEVTKNVAWTNAYQQYSVGDYVPLAPGRRNYVRLYAECEGTTYYSDYFYIDTKAYVSFDTVEAYDILHNDADISIWARNPEAVGLGSIGFYFGTDVNNLQKYEGRSGTAVNWTDPYLHYVVSQFAGMLKPSRQYYYSFYVVTASGVEYKSDTYSFTTAQNIPAVNEEILSSPDKVLQYNGHAYWRFDYKVAHWYEAVAYCEALGGHLVTITSAEEQEKMEQLISGSGLTYWMGGHDKYDEEHFGWYTGEPLVYDKWKSLQPDNWHRLEDYITLTENGEWNDVGENSVVDGQPVFGFICEFDSVKKYTITYHLDGGENAEDNPDEFNENEELTLQNPTKPHYDFAGWYMTEAGDEKFQNGKIYAQNLELYAKWEKTKYTVTLYVNHEVSSTEQEGWVKEYAYEDLYGELPIPEWAGHTFAGWFTEPAGGTAVSGEDYYTGESALYAHWAEKPVYVSFDGNGVYTEPLDEYQKELIPGDAYGTLPKIAASGYNFIGWFMEKQEGTQITEESTVSQNGNHTLYAHWVAKEFSLSFDINMNGKENPESRKIKYNECYGSLPECSAEGYTFLGWFDAPEGTRKITEETLFQELVDVKLYARWDKIEIHTHAYESKITTQPTCTEPGVRTYTCADCGDSYTEEISAKGHTPKAERNGVKEANCTENGYSGDLVCGVCGSVLEKGNTVPAKGHPHTTVQNDKTASCTEDGYTGDTYCIDCEQRILEGTVIKSKGHQWEAGSIVKEVTCKEAGEQEYTCSVCGATKQEEIPVHGHLGREVVKFAKEAACTEDGYTGDTYCLKCYEITKKGEKIPATGHQHKVVMNEKEATCAQEGYTGDTYCIDCEMLVEKGSVVAKTGHIHTILRDTKEATCTQEGYTGDTYCFDCEEQISSGSVIPKKDHQWDQGTITKEATATADGTKTYTCSICGGTKEEKIPAAGPTQPQTTEKDLYGNTLVSEQQIENAVLAMPDDNDPANSTFSLLQARAKNVTKNSITIAWKRVPKATSYTIYGNKCGKGNRYQKLATVSGGQYVHKNLKKGTYYKFLIVANGGGKARAVSKTIHVATTGGKVGNNKSVRITSKKKLTLKKGKTTKITAKVVAKSGKLKVKKHRKLAYETDNLKVATVNKSGKIKTVGKGNCTIYVYAQDGVYAKVKVRVK